MSEEIEPSAEELINIYSEQLNLLFSSEKDFDSIKKPVLDPETGRPEKRPHSLNQIIAPAELPVLVEAIEKHRLSDIFSQVYLIADFELRLHTQRAQSLSEYFLQADVEEVASFNRVWRATLGRYLEAVEEEGADNPAAQDAMETVNRVQEEYFGPTGRAVDFVHEARLMTSAAFHSGRVAPFLSSEQQKICKN